jgi:CelD/BcsL family acetyltransferase involved in cellulose biosynthesis
MNNWHIEQIHGWDQVFSPKHMTRWSDLLDHSTTANVFQLAHLGQVWCDTVGQSLKVTPHALWANDQQGNTILLVGVVEHQGGRYVKRRTFQPMGGSWFCYTDPILVGDAHAVDWRSYWYAVRAQSASFCDQALWRFVNPAFLMSGLGSFCGDDNPVLLLTGFSTLGDALARCSGNHRTDLNRRIRRLSEAGTVSLWTPAVDELRSVMEDFKVRFLPAYHQQWDHRPEGNQLRHAGVVDFLERVLRDGLAEGWAHYLALQVNGQSIAWHIGLEFRQHLYWWVPTHDPAWNDFSAGKILLARTIEQAIIKRYEALHFLTGGHAYKLAWKPESRQRYSVRWHAPHWKGWLLAHYDQWQRSRSRNLGASRS